MDESTDAPDEERGLYPKYRAIKVNKVEENYPTIMFALDSNGESEAVEEIIEPFFLLKFDDPYAREALMAYASAVVRDYPKLAADIRQKLVDTLDDVKKVTYG